MCSLRYMLVLLFVLLFGMGVPHSFAGRHYLSQGNIHMFQFVYPRTDSTPRPSLGVSGMYPQECIVGEPVRIVYVLREFATVPDASVQHVRYRKVGTEDWTDGDGVEKLQDKCKFPNFVASWTSDDPGDYEVQVVIDKTDGTRLYSMPAFFTLIGRGIDLNSSLVTTTPIFESDPVTAADYVDFMNWALDPDGDPSTGDNIIEPYANPYGTNIISARIVDGVNHEIVDIDDEDCPVGWDAASKSFVVISNGPMVEVSWYGAMMYAWAKNKREGLEQAVNRQAWTIYVDRHGYRLATETEWSIYSDPLPASPVRRWIFDYFAENTLLESFELNPLGPPPIGVAKRVVRNTNDGERFRMQPDFTVRDVGFSLVHTTADLWNPPQTDTDGDGDPDYIDMDDDGDLVPDVYEIIHHMDPLDPADGLADQDGDGLPTVFEFATGHDPIHGHTAIEQVFTIKRVPPGIKLLVSERDDLAIAGVKLQLEYSTNMVEWLPVKNYDFAVCGMHANATNHNIRIDQYGQVSEREFDLEAANTNLLTGFFRLTVGAANK